MVNLGRSARTTKVVSHIAHGRSDVCQAGRRPFELAYHGQLDDSRPNNGRPVTGRYATNLATISTHDSASYYMVPT